MSFSGKIKRPNHMGAVYRKVPVKETTGNKDLDANATKIQEQLNDDHYYQRMYRRNVVRCFGLFVSGKKCSASSKQDKMLYKRSA